MGSPTCMTFAEDVVKGGAAVDDCVFIAMKDFESISVNLTETVRKHGERLPAGPEGTRQ